MADIYDAILAAIRKRGKPESRWEKILGLCRQEKPSPTWEKLPTPDFAYDIGRASLWLDDQLAKSKGPPKGIYLGLDTLNMESGPCKNVEIGISSAANPKILHMKWTHNFSYRGDGHLIESLIGMNHVYHKTDISSFADYMLFLGYSGIVLLAAVEAAEISKDFISVWGFHDGDIFFLARKIAGKSERLLRL